MKLLKWLTHPIYLLVIIIAIAIYLNRDALFEDNASSAKKRTESVKTAQVATESEAPDSEMNTAVNEIPSVPGSDAEATKDKAESDTSGETAAPKSAQTAEAVTKTETEKQATSKAATATANADEAGAQASASASSDSGIDERAVLYHNWRQARVAVWQGRLEKAEALYLEVAKQAESVDAWGELGNLYLRTGKVDKAADAFAKGALQAKQGGNLQAAWYLHSVVANLDVEKAASLRQKLTK